MDQRTLIIITVALVAVVAVLAVAIVAGLYLTGGQTYQVPITRTDLPSNIRLQKQHLEIKEFDDPPKESVIQSADDIIGKVSARNIKQGSKITPDDLTDQIKIVQTVESIPAGNRLTRGQLQVVGVDEAPKNVVTSPKEVEGKLVKNGLTSNSPVRSSDVYQSEQKIVLTRERIAANSIIRSSQLKTTSRPEAKAPSDAVTKVENVAGRALKKSKDPGDVIRESDLFPRKEQLSYFIPLYRRAVSIPITNYNNVSYLLRPGDQVDLYVYFSEGLKGGLQKEGGFQLSSYPSLQKIADAAEILALNDVFTQKKVEKMKSGGKKGDGNGNNDGNGGQGGTFTYQNMTLGVTLSEAEKIKLMQGMSQDNLQEQSESIRFFVIVRPRQSDSQYGNRSKNLMHVFDKSLGNQRRKLGERISEMGYETGEQQTTRNENSKSIKVIRGQNEEYVQVPRK